MIVLVTDISTLSTFLGFVTHGRIWQSLKGTLDTDTMQFRSLHRFSIWLH